MIGLIAPRTLALFLAPVSSEAQQAEKGSRRGILETGSPASPTPSQEAFRPGLRELGYVEGQNILLESRYAEGRFERWPDLAAELTHLKGDVLVTSGSQPVQALTHATSTIPIVGVVLADPLGTGCAASVARPGGNITGLAFQQADFSTKRLELLKEAVPGGTRVAVLWDSHNPASANAVRGTEEAAQSLGLQVHLLEVQGPHNFDSACAAAQKGHAQAFWQVGSPLFSTHRQALLDLVAKSRLPATCETRAFVVEGGLLAYGPRCAARWRRAATYVDKILQGPQPAALPIEQPRKCALVINLKTAKALDLTIPPRLLCQADEVIRED